MMRDDTLRMMIPARLDHFLREWHHSCHQDLGNGYNRKSAGLSGGGYGATIEDLEESCDNFAVSVLDAIWWSAVPMDSRLVIEQAMRWLDGVEMRIRRDPVVALTEGVEVLCSGLRKEGISL